MSTFNRICRLILSLFLGVLLVGFGACGAMGALNGLSNMNGSSSVSGALMFSVLGLLGLALAWGCGVAIRKLWRQPPPNGQ